MLTVLLEMIFLLECINLLFIQAGSAGHAVARPIEAVQVPAARVLKGYLVEQETKMDLVPARKIRFCLTACKGITQDPWVLGMVTS